MTETETETAGTFEWRGQTLPLLDHPYNDTALNERAWEVPLAWSWLRRTTALSSAHGLEVGNVLNHYADVVQPPPRRVVDLWEVADGVVNEDVLELIGVYDWIVSISTVEHVGGDDALGRYAPVDALWRLQDRLARGGRLLITVPLGQQPYLDVAILEGELGPLSGGSDTYEGTMVRDDDDGSWRWAEGQRVWRPGRGNGWPSAVWVAEWARP